MISTRGRYAIRVMLDLAEHRTGSYIPMKEVAQRQEISLKYLEKILPMLTREKLIEGVAGKGGGYRLTRPPEECRIGEILCITEGDLAPVSCLAKGVPICERAPYCKTLPMWQKYYEMTLDYFNGITLADLLQTETQNDYVI